MQKIMFNDKYGLTDAVLQRRKTMTRRVIGTVEEIGLCIDRNGFAVCTVKDCGYYTGTVKSKYAIGEEVAIAQAYKNDDMLTYNAYHDDGTKREDGAERHKQMLNSKGYRNKMFVRADLMPHRIRITGIKAERLQDISDEDCMKEGIYTRAALHSLHVNGYAYTFDSWSDRGIAKGSDTARGAFSVLIDKVSGKGTWDRNPWVFVYEFELIK